MFEVIEYNSMLDCHNEVNEKVLFKGTEHECQDIIDKFENVQDRIVLIREVD